MFTCYEEWTVQDHVFEELVVASFSLHEVQMSSPVEKAPPSPKELYFVSKVKVASYCTFHTFRTMEPGATSAGRPVRKSSIFPARSVHFRPSRHPDFCPRLLYFRSKRSLYLRIRGISARFAASRAVSPLSYPPIWHITKGGAWEGLQAS